jgi:hypothetical protein
MGGTAFLIYGDFDPARAAAAAPPPSVLGRIFGKSAPTVKRHAYPDGRALLEFPADAFAGALAADYRNFLRRHFTDPWPATAMVLEYVGDDSPGVYLRANREPGEEQGPWYIQLTFSGASGLTETSAAVAAHWARWWYDERAEAVAQLLEPHGFVLRHAEPLADSRFIPTDQLGYADITEGEFELDAGMLESEDDPDATIADLTRQHAAAIERRRCACQHCAGAPR